MTNNYYEKHKERIQKQANERCQNLPQEEKEKGVIRTFMRNESKS